MNNVPRRSGQKCDCMDLYGAGTRSATLDDWTVGRGKGEQGVLRGGVVGKEFGGEGGEDGARLRREERGYGGLADAGLPFEALGKQECRRYRD